MKASKLKVGKFFIEASLWLLFLFACITAGYFQGLKPHFKVTDYVINPTEIHILTISPYFFPAEIISEIEKSTHTKIFISTVQTWENLKVQMVASPSPEIVFLPAYWVQTMQKEGLLETDPRLKKTFTPLVSSDFTMDNEFFLPTYWAQLSLINHTEKDKSILFINDADLFLNYVSSFADVQKKSLFLKHAFRIENMSLWFKEISENLADIVLSTHPLNTQKENWKKTEFRDSFYLLGFSLSKNHAHLKESLAVLEYYTSQELQSHLLEQIPFASTLKAVEETSIAKEKKSSYLRTLDFNKLIIIKYKDSGAEEKVQKIINWPKQN